MHKKSKMLFDLFSVDICTDGLKTMVNKTADALAQIKVVVPNHANTHCILS